MKLLVSIHDVTPAHDRPVQRMWSHCVSIGVKPALFVVPNWHGEWPIEEFRVFNDWLRECESADDGAEIFLHGDRHREETCRRAFGDELRALGRTDREAEFLSLSYGAARQRIENGLRRLRRIGLSPVGFVAPAWLAHRDCSTAVNDCGLAISEDVRSITLHRFGIRLNSPVLRWSTRAPWRATASAFVASAASRLYDKSWFVRIALHPGDVEDRATWDSVRSTLDYWLERRRPWRYADL